MLQYSWSKHPRILLKWLKKTIKWDSLRRLFRILVTTNVYRAIIGLYKWTDGIEMTTWYLCHLTSEHVTVFLPAIQSSIWERRNDYPPVIRIIYLYQLEVILGYFCMQCTYISYIYIYIYIYVCVCVLRVNSSFNFGFIFPMWIP